MKMNATTVINYKKFESHLNIASFDDGESDLKRFKEGDGNSCERSNKFSTTHLHQRLRFFLWNAILIVTQLKSHCSNLQRTMKPTTVSRKCIVPRPLVEMIEEIKVKLRLLGKFFKVSVIFQFEKKKVKLYISCNLQWRKIFFRITCKRMPSEEQRSGINGVFICYQWYIATCRIENVFEITGLSGL